MLICAPKMLTQITGSINLSVRTFEISHLLCIKEGKSDLRTLLGGRSLFPKESRVSEKHMAGEFRDSGGGLLNAWEAAEPCRVKVLDPNTSPAAGQGFLHK